MNARPKEGTAEPRRGKLSTLPGAALLALFVGSSAAAFQADPSDDAGPTVRFLEERWSVWEGTSAVIPFALDAPSAQRFQPEVHCAGSILEVLRAPEVLAGEGLGFLRVQGKGLGVARLQVGEALLEVHVLESPVPLDQSAPTPRILSPVAGAALWGTVHVGVELGGLVLRRLPSEAELYLEITSDSTERERLAPIARPRTDGPDQRATFVLDTERFGSGVVRLQAVYIAPSGTRRASQVVDVRVVPPDDSALLVAECEELADVELPEAFARSTKPFSLGRGPDEGAFTVHTREDRALVAPVRIHDPGRYQMIVVARGDVAAECFPSLGLALDAPRSLLTSGELFDREWCRLALGHPVWLDAGEHDLALLFLNDRSIVPTNDRNLYLDRFELMRLPNASKATRASVVEAALPVLSSAARIAGGLDRLGRDHLGPAAPALGSGGLTVALDRPLDGATITGRLHVTAVCRWDGDVDAPRTELVLNDRVVMSQMAARPHFALDRTSFAEGANRLYLRAQLTDGRTSRTPEQVVYVERRIERTARDYYYFEVLDEGWEPSIREVFTRGAGNQKVAKLKRGAPVRLHLPEELAGEFQTQFRTRGPRKGDGSLRFRIEHGESAKAANKPKTLKPKPYWSYLDGGKVALSRGPKSLVIERTGKQGDLQFLAFVLRRRGAPTDVEPPTARLLYPQPGHRTDEIDVCIVEGWDDDQVTRADVWIDGRPQGTFGYVPTGAGYVVLPLFTKALEPGEHRVFCRLEDARGNVAETGEVVVRTGLRGDADLGPHARAVHLLNRFGYGPEPQELAKCLLQGEQAWLRRSLGPLGVGERTALGAAEARMSSDSPGSISRAALAQALRSDNPVRTRFAFWVENHFLTWINKTRGPAEWNEHKRFLALGAAPFNELLWASATSPAMIHYLDQARSYGSRLNENYAREILELHCLGVEGGYDQADVTQLVSILAGLTLTEEALPGGQGGDARDAVRRVLRFDPSLGDARERELLGVHLREASAGERFDRVRFMLELLAAHPQTANFVVRSLVEHYVATPAPEELVRELSSVFLQNGGDMRTVLLALAQHEGFWRERRPRIATPFDYGMRLARSTGALDVDGALHGFLERSAMGVFRRETPDGYPEEDEAWVDGNALIQRRALVDDLTSSVRRWIPRSLTRTPVGDPREWHERMIGVVAARLLGTSLSEASYAAALAFCDGIEEPKDIPRELPGFIAQLPEANLR